VGNELRPDQSRPTGDPAGAFDLFDDGSRNGRAISVLLVDDHDVFRQGLCTLLSEQGLQIVAEAANAEDALKLVARAAPDVAVMDLNLPGISGIEATRRLAAVAPQTRVLVLTISGDETHVTEAIVAGACGYLLKDASIHEIASGIRAAAIGESLISPKVATKLLDQVRARSVDEDAAEASPELSGREIDVLRLVYEGKDNAAIGAQLFISPQTVKNHISNILAKLQMHNRIQAAVYAVRRGIV
jgi:DNA-binding NarL/FixJ family response regulator